MVLGDVWVEELGVEAPASFLPWKLRTSPQKQPFQMSGQVPDLEPLKERGLLQD